MGNKEMESQLANLKNEVKSLEETLVKKNAEIQEKEKEFHGIDDIIKGNEEIIQGKNREIQGMDSIIKGLKETIQVKEETIRRKDKEIQEKDNIIKGLEEVILKYKEIEKDKEIKIQKEDSVTQEKDDETKIQDKDNVTQEKDDETKVQDKDIVIQEKDDETKIQDKAQETGDETKIQDKDNVTQEKDYETKQNKDNITQEKDDETKIQDKDNVTQEKDDETKIQDKDNVTQEKDDETKVQDKDIVIQEKDDETKQNKDNITQEKDDETKIQDKDNVTQEKDDETKIQDKDNVIKEKDEETKIQEYAREIQEKEKIIKDLEQDNNKLRNEAAKYQYALGTATSYRLSDNDKNNPVALKDDIIRLQHSLEEYITKCKGSVIAEINLPGVQNLLKKYGSQTIITIDQKALIKAVLKRHVIEKIIEYAEEHFSNPNARDIEVIMYKKCKDLVKLAKDFAEQRDGVDETTKALPIKLRQQICAALGNRGFNDVINNIKNYKNNHGFIRKNQYNLNKEINKYRKLNPEKKQKIEEIEDMAGDIIQKVVNLFWFRLNVQEPITSRIWFKNNEKINPNAMEGKWEDNDIDNIVVDICYFPLIANNLTRQVYTHAKILHMHKNDPTNIDNSSESVSSNQTESKE